RALVSDLIHRDVRATAFGVYHGLNGVAAFVASFVFGILWDSFGFEVPFVLAGALSLLAAVLLVGYMYKHRGHGHFGEPVRG
ncbi:MAG: MFS transporter, partial [Candidatus Magasanikbacteria bacterium]|nr:MFS transporter [Candidatus Magasanikbacteria bacterium]